MLIDGDGKPNELVLLQFRMLSKLNFVDHSLHKKFLSTLASIGFKNKDSKEMVEAMVNVAEWNNSAILALLSGRLLSRSVKNLTQRK